MRDIHALLKAKVRGVSLQYINMEALYLHSSVNLELSFSLVLEAFKTENKSRPPHQAPKAKAIYLE